MVIYLRKVLYFPIAICSKLERKAKEKGLNISAYVRMVLLERWEEEENVQNYSR